MTRSALVIGGGIAGPATAMALQSVGVEATVYEAHPAGADGVGTFLTLASNGLQALGALGAEERALAAGFPTPSIVLRSGTGKRLGETRTGHAVGEGTPSHTLMRAELAAVLRDEALGRGVPVEHGKRLVSVERVGGAVRAAFADGSEAQADVLVGCDGVHSTVRRLIDPAAPAPVYGGLVGTGGVARDVELDSAPGEYQMIFGRRAFFGYVVAPEREVWWFANVPCAAADGPMASGEALRRELLDLFAGDAGPACDLIAATESLSPPSPVHAILHLPRWHDDRMVVAGDAAHAPTPSSGQGASLALEDAVVLAACLRDEPDPRSASACFEQARRARVERIARWAARINSSKAAGPLGRVLRDALLPVFLRLPAGNKAQREVFDHQVCLDRSQRNGLPAVQVET